MFGAQLRQIELRPIRLTFGATASLLIHDLILLRRHIKVITKRVVHIVRSFRLQHRNILLILRYVLSN